MYVSIEIYLVMQYAGQGKDEIEFVNEKKGIHY